MGPKNGVFDEGPGQTAGQIAYGRSWNSNLPAPKARPPRQFHTRWREHRDLGLKDLWTHLSLRWQRQPPLSLCYSAQDWKWRMRPQPVSNLVYPRPFSYPLLLHEQEYRAHRHSNRCAGSTLHRHRHCGPPYGSDSKPYKPPNIKLGTLQDGKTNWQPPGRRAYLTAREGKHPTQQEPWHSQTHVCRQTGPN